MEFKNRHAVHYPKLVPCTDNFTACCESVREMPQMRGVQEVENRYMGDTHEKRVSLPPADMVGYLYLQRQTEYIIRRCEAQLQKITKKTQISVRNLRRERGEK